MKEKNLSSLRRILPLLRPYRLLAAATLLCSLVYVAGQLLIPILSGQAFGADFAGHLRPCRGLLGDGYKAGI